jgi:ATP-dependent helicase/nuclease subunit B
VLYDFEGKNARFVYLFRRLEEDVRRVVLDMLGELKRSDFEPLDFELDFSKWTIEEGLYPMSRKSPHPFRLRGIVDRVDGYGSGDKMYIRVIDYKTGKKSLNLSDVLRGRDMQMLIYLFALQYYGGDRYGKNIVPAGALYIPARDVILRAPRNASDEEIDKMREKEHRRAGIILSDPDIVEAMENGDEKKYLPVKYSKDGVATGDSLVTSEQIILLSAHVNNMLRRAATEILDGSIECRPYYKGANDNACMYCEYSSVCAFNEDTGDSRRFVPNMKASEVWEAMGD